MESATTSFHQLKSKLILGLLLNAVIILTEFLGGMWINSVGLMSDAGHNLIDQGALFMAFYAHLLSRRPATETRTFGYHRAGIIAAFVNGVVLLVTALILGYVAVQRILTPVPVPGVWVLVIALGSFLGNLTVALLFQQGAKNDLNIRGAFWHMLTDAWVSLGVVGCGLIMMLTNQPILDPLISLIIVAVIGKGAWPLVRESLDILMESTPPGIKTAHVVQAIEGLPGVRNVHDLHIWAVEPKLVMLTCHVLVEEENAHLTQELLATIKEKVANEFGIHHLTIQLETICGNHHEVHCNLNHLPSSLQSDTSLSAHPH